MEEFWLHALEKAERAERQARELRARFGRQAEAHCLEELHNCPPHDPKRRDVEDVRRALRWT